MDSLPTIRAEAHSDDYNVEVMFDAIAYFMGATDADIIALANIGWGGDYEADEVAHVCSETDPAVQRLFDYLDLEPSNYGEAVGFECHVNEEDAMQYLAEARPAVLAYLERDDDEEVS